MDSCRSPLISYDLTTPSRDTSAEIVSLITMLMGLAESFAMGWEAEAAECSGAATRGAVSSADAPSSLRTFSKMSVVLDFLPNCIPFPLGVALVYVVSTAHHEELVGFTYMSFSFPLRRCRMQV